MLYHQHHNMLSPNLFSPKSLFIKEISSKELTWWKWSKHWPPGLQLVPYCFGKPLNNVFFFQIWLIFTMKIKIIWIKIVWNLHSCGSCGKDCSHLELSLELYFRDNFEWVIYFTWYVGDNYHCNFIWEIKGIILSGWYIWPLFDDLKSFRWRWKWIHG